MNQLLVIDEVVVRQDNSGRYCLNFFYHAQSGERRHETSLWDNLQQTNEPGQFLKNTGIPVSVTKNQPDFFKSNLPCFFACSTPCIEVAA